MNGFYLTGVSLHNSVLSHFILPAAWRGKESRSPISSLQMRTLFLEELSQGPTPDTELRSKRGLSVESPPWEPFASAATAVRGSKQFALGDWRPQSWSDPGSLEAFTLVTFPEIL